MSLFFRNLCGEVASCPCQRFAYRTAFRECFGAQCRRCRLLPGNQVVALGLGFDASQRSFLEGFLDKSSRFADALAVIVRPTEAASGNQE